MSAAPPPPPPGSPFGPTGGQSMPAGTPAPGYGQSPPPVYGAPGPFGAPPKKPGVPIWAWVLGGIGALVLLCCCGLLGLGYLADQSSPSTTSVPATSEQSTTATADPSSTSTTTPTSTSTSTSSSTAPSPTVSQSVPPTPSGSTANTDVSQRLTADKLEAEVAKGFTGLGISASDVSCDTGITLVADRTATCTAPNPYKKGETADIDVKVEWAQVSKTATTTRIQWYLTFESR